MTAHSVAALVEEALSHARDHTEDGLRSAAIDLAFDRKLVPEQLAALLSALEQRTGTKLERRTSPRATIMAGSTAKH